MEIQAKRIRPAYYTLGIAAVLGIVMNAFFSLGQENGIVVFAYATMLSGGAVLAGALLGFLFGIPKTREQDRGLSADTEEPNGNKQKPRQAFQSNTSLEQVSDWLTKILIGAGLSQLALLPDQLKTVGDYWSDGLGGSDASGVYGIAVGSYFLICGFLVGYFWTRVDFYELLSESETARDSLRRLEDKEKQEDKNRKALMIVSEQLYDASIANLRDLKNAISDADAATRTQIFFSAKNFRKTQRKHSTTISRAIPVFESLIELDPQKKYHRNFAQLGYALKDGKEPNYEEAEKNLTQAIESRSTDGWPLYELNRAICRVELHREDEAILSDLRLARDRGLEAAIENDEVIRNWIAESPIDRRLV